VTAKSMEFDLLGKII